MITCHGRSSVNDLYVKLIIGTSSNTEIHCHRTIVQILSRDTEIEKNENIPQK